MKDDVGVRLSFRACSFLRVVEHPVGYAGLGHRMDQLLELRRQNIHRLHGRKQGEMKETKPISKGGGKEKIRWRRR